MCWRDDVVRQRHCSSCGKNYYGDLGHRNCLGPQKENPSEAEHRVSGGSKNVSEPQKSPNWDSRQNISQFVEEGFPFDEGWPECGPGDDKVFELVTRDGQRHDARVDFSTQYRAEGLQWRTLSREVIYKHVVIAWREKQ